MRSDQTAEFVATRPYRTRDDACQALYEHARRVSRAAKDDALSKEPALSMSGSTIMRQSDYECAACCRDVGKAFAADSTTHRIITRSGEPTRRTVGLCVPCWSRHARFDGDEHLPTAAVRFA
ncbi:hypothetical protein [Streptomyces sp. SM8]|jgi:hypothetical protein|uniref:hypothetical protein n=1 Tax=Streptomyces sp. SM8 TaxID=1195457 RepID=UPI0002831135|nr:hypothetical protein [Streptomyces sp. SM8]PKA37943.1 hypothetical protein SM8_029435 [Streptomyces sp. SM8]